MDEKRQRSGRSRQRSRPNDRQRRSSHRWSCGAASNARVVRIGDEYRNQIVDTGHAARLQRHRRDGRARRQGRALPDPVGNGRAGKPDRARLLLARRAARSVCASTGIKVIAGLVHHGSGPRYTNLLDPKFPDLLARLCGAGSRERYPWIEAWTPVNEPLTTARFSCLYGHWYPHLQRHRRDLPRDRQPVPRRRSGDAGDPRRSTRTRSCIATEDIGKTFATDRARLPGRARERAALADLRPARRSRRRQATRSTAGCATRRHRRRCWTSSRPATATPDIIGFDHYLTSERFLDHRVERYPGVEPGSNGRDTLRRCRGGSGRQAAPAARPGASPARDVGALRDADRDHRGPSRLHARRAGALAASKCGPRPSRSALAAPTSGR